MNPLMIGFSDRHEQRGQRKVIINSCASTRRLLPEGPVVVKIGEENLLEPTLHVRYSDHSDVEVTFPNGVTEGIQLVQVHGNHYRLESSSLFGEPNIFYFDVIEIEPTGQNSGVFRRIVQRSGFVVLDRLLPRAIAESPLLPGLLEKVMQLGGNWERFFGGVLLVHLPPGVDFDLDSELQKVNQPH